MIKPKTEKGASKPKGSTKESIDLNDCFNSFSREEMLTGDDKWYCPVCKEHQVSLKKLSIYKMPRILVLQLKRFSNRKGSSQRGYFNMAYAQVVGQEKLGSLVNFPVKGLDAR